MYSFTCSKCGQANVTEEVEGSCCACKGLYRLEWPGPRVTPLREKTISAKYEGK